MKLIGAIISVSPENMRKFRTKDGRVAYSWSHPVVTAFEPAKSKPDDVATVERIMRLTGEAERQEALDGAEWARRAHGHFVRNRVARGWADMPQDERRRRVIACLNALRAQWPLDDVAGAVAEFRRLGLRHFAEALEARPLDRPMAPTPKGTTREEQRRKTMLEVGDWYLVRQPSDKRFPGVLQYHYRGVWTEDERKDFLKRAREIVRENDAQGLAKLWREAGFAVMKSPLESIQRDARKEQDVSGNVTGAIERHLILKPTDVARFRRALDEDRVINRGNCHIDWRMQAPTGDYVLGYTVMTPGAIAMTLRSGKLLHFLRDKLLENRPNEQIQCTLKASQPLAWLRIVKPGRPVWEREPGEIGATVESAGLFVWIADLEVIYGVRKSDAHEVFIWVKNNAELHERIGGRWMVSLIPGGERYPKAPEKEQWLAIHPRQDPYWFYHDWETEVAKAKREKVDLIGNFTALDALDRFGYYREKGLLEAWERWRAEAEIPANDVVAGRGLLPPALKRAR